MYGQLYYRDLFHYTALWSDTCAGVNGLPVVRARQSVIARSKQDALSKLRKGKGSWVVTGVEPKLVQQDAVQWSEEPVVTSPPVPPERAQIEAEAQSVLGPRHKAIIRLQSAG